MTRKFRRRQKRVIPIKKPTVKEPLFARQVTIPLNIAQTDRISFSVLRNRKNEIKKIENVSYEINLEGQWEWVVRFDDHSGLGNLHRHIRISLKDQRTVESSIKIKTKLKNKNEELTWACKDIQDNYLEYRERFLKDSSIDLY